jgi:hypothetical protein
MEMLPEFDTSSTPKLTVEDLRALLRDLTGAEEEKWLGIIVGD